MHLPPLMVFPLLGRIVDPHHPVPETHRAFSTHDIKNVAVYYQDVRGMRTKTTDFFLITATCDYDIIILTEPGLHADIQNSELTSNYTIFRCDRNKQTSSLQRGGGVLIAVKSALRCSSITLTDCNSLEQVAVSVILPETTIHLCGIYIRPTSPPEVYTTHASAVKKICDLSCVSDTIVVVGDYNLPGLSWFLDDDLNSYLPSNASSEAETTFAEMMISTGLHQVNSLLNTNDRLLDLAFVSDAGEVEVLDPPTNLLRLDAHHKPFVLRIEVTNNRHLTRPESNSELSFDFNRCDFVTLNQILSSINWYDLLSNESSDEAVALFYTKLFDVFRDAVPYKRKRLNLAPKLPWWSPELRHLRNVLRKARKRFFRSRSNEDRENLKSLERVSKLVFSKLHKSSGIKFETQPVQFLVLCKNS